VIYGIPCLLHGVSMNIWCTDQLDVVLIQSYDTDSKVQHVSLSDRYRYERL